MRRRLLNLTAAMFLVLSAACFALQYRRPNMELMRRGGPGPTVIALHEGNLSLSWEPGMSYRPRWAGQTNRHGFRYNVYSDRSWYVWGPLWVAGAVLATAAALSAAFAGWPRRRKAGRCPACGYDLRATPDRCPECGAVSKPVPEPAT